MNTYPIYKDFLNNIFGEEKICLTETDFINNNIVGAIGRNKLNGEYDFFTSNFRKRLVRLNANYASNKKVLNDIIMKAQNIAKKKWYGEYSELVAYDFFSDFFDLETELLVPKELTFASEIQNRVASSFDGKISQVSFELTFEVKSFTDIAKELLSSIISISKKRNNIFEITVDYNHAIDYTLVEANFSDILLKLNNAISEKKTLLRYQELGLVFRIYYQPKKVITSEGSYLAQSHADAMKYFILNHFDQVFIKEKNLLVYVSHPWFNLTNTSDFLGKKDFIKEFANYCFHDLAISNDSISNVTNKWPNINLKVSEVAKRISGILFLFDNNVVQHQSYDPQNYISIMEGHLFINKKSVLSFTQTDIDLFYQFKKDNNMNLEIYETD